jgi:hypothetical protein
MPVLNSSGFRPAGMFVFAVSSPHSSKPRKVHGGTALMLTSAEAASISKADKVVLKQALVGRMAEVASSFAVPGFVPLLRA